MILIVDDDQDVCKILGLLLKNAGYSTLAMHSLADAYDYFDHGGRPELVVLDLSLVGEDGNCLLRWFQKNDIDPPVIVLSAFVDQLHDKFRGTVAVAEKPITGSAFVNLVKQHASDRAAGK